MAGRVLFADPASPAYYARRRSPDEIYGANKPFLRQEQESYLTTLPPEEEASFQEWVKANNVPFDPSPTADYDMRGFFSGLQRKDPHAQTGVNANDQQLHFSDWWKTPFHESFSAESQFANKEAPNWNERDQLVTPAGKVLFDERALNTFRQSGYNASE